MRVLSLILLLLAAITSHGCGRLSHRTAASQNENFTSVSAADPEMNAAQEQARQTLDAFLSDFKNPKPGQEYFSVKARLPTAGGSFEHIWVEDLSYKGGTFTGKLGNDPVDLPGLKLGSVVSFRRDQVSDWMIQGKGGMQGGYTVKVLQKRMR